MRILRFDIQNDKKVESFVHDANGEHVAIAGETGTGKTTAASALWDIASKSSDCLTHGERKGHITLHLGDGQPDLIATREFTKKTNTVRIQRKDGEAVSAKEFKAMLSSLSENPHKIVDMKPTERVATLLQAADLGDVSLEELDEHIEGAERARLDAGRRAEEFVPGEKPEKVGAVDVSSVSADIDAARTHNDMIDQDQREIDVIVETGKRVSGRVVEIESDIAELDDRLVDLRSQLDNNQDSKRSITDDYKQRKADHDELERIDTTEMQEQLASATERNKQANAYEQWTDRRASHADLMQQRDCADETVKELRDDKKALLDNAKWPLDGLSVEEGDVVYNGALFANLGQSEQMLVCAALSIKDILAHPLHVVRMDGVESMSEADFIKLQALFGDNDIQVVSTRVSRGEIGEGELTITEKEDG